MKKTAIILSSVPNLLVLTVLAALTACTPMSVPDYPVPVEPMIEPLPAPVPAPSLPNSHPLRPNITIPPAAPLQQTPRAPTKQDRLPQGIPLHEALKPEPSVKPMPAQKRSEPVVKSPTATTTTSRNRPVLPRQPSVTYTPDRASTQRPAPVSLPPAQRSTGMQSASTVTPPPFWEQAPAAKRQTSAAARPRPTQSHTNNTANQARGQGRVAVEVLDMRRDKPMAGSRPSRPTAPKPAPKANDLPINSPVVAVLLKQANNEMVAGNNDRAAATLERALRIAPNDATLWLRLAEINQMLGKSEQAKSMANKALSLAPSDERIALRAQRLLK